MKTFRTEIRRYFWMCFPLLCLALATSWTSAATRYVNMGNISPAQPFLTWTTAATNIQDAVDAAGVDDEIIVTNGLYATGGALIGSPSFGSNRVVINKAITVRSINGPGVTVIAGAQGVQNALRCVYVGAGAVLSGFSLTNGTATEYGGGAWCEPSAVLTNCIVINNHVNGGEDGNGGGVYGGAVLGCQLIGNSSREEGGGAMFSTLVNCVVTGNIAGDTGGGVSGCVLYNCLVISNRTTALSGGGAAFGALINCTVVGNSALAEGGGTDSSALTNCIVYANAAPANPNYVPTSDGDANITFTCTFPLPTNGIGNITNAPLFTDTVAGNYQLRSGSPGIDAGTNLSAFVTHDLAGLRRPLDGDRDGIARFDMGAFEFNPMFFTSIVRAGNNVRVCWFDTLPGMQLQGASSISSQVWTNLSFPPGTNCVEFPIDAANRFFRLTAP
jgi:hypothetical protein